MTRDYFDYQELYNELAAVLRTARNVLDHHDAVTAVAQQTITSNAAIVSALDALGDDAAVRDVLDARKAVAGDAARRKEIKDKTAAAIAARQAVVDELNGQPPGDQDIADLKRRIAKLMTANDGFQTRGKP